MKYETPELTALTSAINAIQSPLTKGVRTSATLRMTMTGILANQDWKVSILPERRSSGRSGSHKGNSS